MWLNYLEYFLDFPSILSRSAAIVHAISQIAELDACASTVEVGRRKRYQAIVGSEEEYRRVYGLLKESSVKIGFAGFVSADGSEHKTENYIGKLNQLNEIIEIYKIDEVIFCAKNVSSEKKKDLDG